MTTLEAIDASIKKWKANTKVADLTDARISYKDCPLCHKFHEYYNAKNREAERSCMGCPIYEYSGFRFCQGTPYEQAEVQREDYEDLEAFKIAAQREVDFLEKVRQSFLDNAE
jgi:hypothetical protein